MAWIGADWRAWGVILDSTGPALNWIDLEIEVGFCRSLTTILLLLLLLLLPLLLLHHINTTGTKVQAGEDKGVLWAVHCGRRS
jgi:hypothetical protein